ncbi:MAG: hypothetical protein FWF86_00330 [Clostridia bacterium]|nr:hypothetical protein [Clostridia bacterium]
MADMNVREQVYFNSDNCFTLREPLGIKALTFTWMPSWWKANYGIVMDERYSMDADYRMDAAAAMERFIAGRFPMMRIGNASAAAAPVPPNWINATTVAAAGGRVYYSGNHYPTTKPLSLEDIDKLELPENIESVFPYSETIRQTVYMNEAHQTGFKPHLFKNSIVNDLVQLCGDQIMLEMMDETSRFRTLLAYSLGMWKKTMAFNFAKGSMPPIFMLLNCATQIIGPKAYEEYFFTHDMNIIRMFYDHQQRFMLHHCGHFDHFIPVYRKIPHVDMIQIGFTSDAGKALDAFPEADVEYIFSPYEVMNSSREALRKRTLDLLSRIRGEERRFSIVVADLETGVPDENIVEIYNCCKAFA